MAKKRKGAKRKSGMGKISISRFNVKRFSLKELKMARRNGLKAKKPAKPKSKTIEALQNYISRFNAWVDAIKDNARTRQQVLQLQGMANKCKLPGKKKKSRRRRK